MPPVIAFIASGITFIATMGAAGSGIAALVVATTAVVAASRLLKPKINFSVDDNDRSRQTTVRSTTEPRKLVYGETLVSGPLTYAQVSGANNKYMHQVVALAGHELTAIKKIYFDDKIIDLTNSGVYNPTTKLVTSGFFGPKNNEAGTSETIVYIDTRLGATSQTVYAGLRADAKTATEYLATHLGNGVASLYTRWTINEGSREVWDEVGTVQNIKALVQGKKVYDPRLEVAANSGNPAFAGNSPTNAAYVKYDDDSLSTASIDRGEQGKNPALMIADYLMDSEFGLGISATKIDWSAIITAADACDTLVPIPNSATQKRFFGSGVIFGADPYAKSIEKILSGMNGSLAYSQGKYIVHAGIFVPASEDITEDDIIGKVDIRTAIPRSDRLNQIKGLFIDPTEQYKMMEFGPVTVSGAIARDNGEVLEEEIKLPFTDNRYAAQRIAFKQVNQSFLQTVITVPVNLKGMRIAIGDRVRVYLSDLESVDSGQWNPKIFKCINWSFAENGEGGINLTLIEDAEARYNDPAATDYSTITAAGVIARNLPDVPAPTNFGITAAINSIELSWDNPSDALAWEQIWVYRSTSATTPTDSDTPIVKFRGTSYTDQRAAADAQGNAIEYYYWIQAVRYPQGSTPASGSNVSKSAMLASSPAKIGATKIGFGVMGEDSIDTAQIITDAVGSEQIAQTLQSSNWSVPNQTGWQISKNGDTTFNNTVVRGNISATTGTVGGFTIGSTDLIAGDEATRVSLSTADGISLGDNTFADAPFRVTPAGVLTATSATITGAITATSLTLSGITIPKTDLATGVQTSLGSADSAIQDADTSVNLGLNAGSVGGITINSASLTSGTHATYASTDQGFFLGSDGSMSFADGTNQTLTIDTSGNLAVTGTVNASAGEFTGSVSIGSTGAIYGGTMDEFLKANTSGFFLGYDTNAYKLSVGDANGEVLTWDGTKLNVEANTVSFSTGGEQDYSSESRYTTSQKSATVVLANNSSYFLFDNRRQDLAFPDFIVSYYLGPLTSGTQSSAANALNGIMENIKAELFYADASTGSPGTWTSLVSVDATSWDVASGPVFPGYVYSNFRVRESGTYVASLDTRNDILDDYPTISPFGDALDGTSVPVGLVDNDYFINIPLSKNTFVFPKGRYFIKVVITVTDGSLSPYPATGSPTATERRISIPNASSFVHPDFGQSVFVGGAHTTIFTDNNRDNETLIKGGSVYLMSKEGANAADQDSTAIFFGGRGTTGGTPSAAYGPLHGLYFFNDRDSIGSGSGILGSIGSPQFSMYVPYDGSKLTFGGDVNFTDGLYINGVAVNAGAVTGPAGSNTQVQFNNNGALGASSDFTFNDSTDTLTVKNLTVSGTTTTVNTDNLTVKDPNITLNYSTGDSSSTADNAGITIQDAVNSTTDASILWKTASDTFEFSHGANIPKTYFKATDQDAESGTWTSSTTAGSWGTIKLAAGYSYTSNAGAYKQYNIPAGADTCYMSLLKWSDGGYVDVHAIQADGGQVFLGRISTGQSVENTNEGDPVEHDGQAIVKIGTGLSSFSSIRITNKRGTFYFTGVAFSTQELDNFDSGMIAAETLHSGVLSNVTNTNWDAAYTYSQVGHLPLAGGTLTGALSGTSGTFTGAISGGSFELSGISVIDANQNINAASISTDAITSAGDITLTSTATSSPSINFNSSTATDPAVDMAIKLVGDDLHFYEPEDSNKVHFKIYDDTGVDAPFGYWVNGTRLADANRNLTVGTISSGDINTTGNIAINNSATYASFTLAGAQANGVSYALQNAIPGVANGGFSIRRAGSVNTLAFDTSDNATFAGTISSGAITATGNITTTGNGSFALLQGTGIGVDNASQTSKHGISLYSGSGSSTNPIYGMMFSGTSGSGTHGSVTGDWATYFTMNSTPTRGWIFRDQSTPANVASISATGNASFSGTVTSSGAIIAAGNSIQMAGTNGRVKYGVWSGTPLYGVGMVSGYTFGALNNQYAMSFQMNDDDDRGFWWGDDVHTNAQGAMALTTDGYLTVASGMRLGFGQSDTTHPIGGLQVSGKIFSHSGQVWSATTQGTSTGSIHLDPNTATNDAGSAITFGASDTGGGANAQAGIYIRSDGAYGTKMYLSTTDSYSAGSKTALSLDAVGNVSLARGSLQMAGVQLVDQSRNLTAVQGNFSSTLQVGGGATQNPFNATASTRLLFGGGDASAQENYYIGTNLEDFGGSYTKLDLRWHTGIRMGAQGVYGGVRFYSDEDLTTKLMSIGEGSGNTDVKVYSNLHLSAATTTASGIAGARVIDIYGSSSQHGSVIAEGNVGASFVAMNSGLSATNLPSLYFSNGLRFATATNKTTAGFAEKLRINADGVRPTFLIRAASNMGHLVGTYNNVGANETHTSPIYTIGSAYNPTLTALSNMYGIGYTNTAASFISFTGQTNWGMYVAADGDARIWLDGSSGNISSKGSIYAANHVYVAQNLYLGNGSHGRFYGDSAARTAFADGSFYIQGNVPNYYNYAPLQYHGSTSGTTHFFRGNALNGNSWSIGTTGVAAFTNGSYSGTLTTGGDIQVNGNQVYTAAIASRVKFAVWTDNNYGIGMGPSYTFGALNNDYAMSFQMNDDSERGFWWGDAVHTNAQGAMALSTDGYLTVAGGMRIGYGQSDTTKPSAGLQVNAAIAANGGLTQDNHTLINGSDTWYRTTSNHGIYFSSYTGGVHMSDTTWVRVYNGKAFYVPNQIAATGNITAYYSDERLKTKTGNIENALDKVRSLSGFKYVENDLAKELGYTNEKQQVGLSAQEIQAVLPEAVSLAPIDMDTDEHTGEITSKSGENYLTVDYAKLVPLLVEAIKELTQEVESLKTKLKEK